MVKKVAGPNRKGPKGQTNIGKKIPDTPSKKQPTPMSAKAAASKMGSLMHSRVRSCKKPTFR
jgi:hypothetical protein